MIRLSITRIGDFTGGAVMGLKKRKKEKRRKRRGRKQKLEFKMIEEASHRPPPRSRQASPSAHTQTTRAASSHGSVPATTAASLFPIHLGSLGSLTPPRLPSTLPSERRNSPTLSRAQPLKRGPGRCSSAVEQVALGMGNPHMSRRGPKRPPPLQRRQA